MNTVKTESLSVLKTKAQKCFNAFIRDRDKDKKCIYCGTTMNKFDKANPIEAAHFHPVSTSEALRFDENNCFGAHRFCNQDDNRDAIIFNVGKRLTIPHIADLAIKAHSLAKFTRDEILEIIEKYKKFRNSK